MSLDTQRTWWRRSLMIVTPVLVVACSSDDSTSPSTTADPPSDVEAALELVVGRPASVVMECSAGNLLDGAANADLFAFVADSVLSALAAGEDIESFYGTWADTSPSGSDGMGVVRTSDSPSNGIRVELVGTDTGGMPIAGSLTLSGVELSIVEGESSVEIDAAAEIAIVEDMGESITFDGMLSAVLPIESGGTRGLSASLSFEGTGNVCELDYEISIAWDDATQHLEITGWYLVDVRVNARLDAYGVGLTSTAIDSITADLWVGSTQSPLALAHVTARPEATSDCVTGQISSGGVMRGEIISMYCGTDSMAVFVVSDGDTIPVEEILDGLELPRHVRHTLVERP